jgi:hypothetical protein
MAFEHEVSPRIVLKWDGAAASIVICSSALPNFGMNTALAADLGEGDVAINYAYAREHWKLHSIQR